MGAHRRSTPKVTSTFFVPEWNLWGYKLDGDFFHFPGPDGEEMAELSPTRRGAILLGQQRANRLGLQNRAVVAMFRKEGELRRKEIEREMARERGALLNREHALQRAQYEAEQRLRAQAEEGAS